MGPQGAGGGEGGCDDDNDDQDEYDDISIPIVTSTVENDAVSVPIDIDHGRVPYRGGGG